MSKKDLIESVSSEMKELFRKEFPAQAELWLSEKLQSYKSKVARKAWKVSQKWMQEFDQEAGPVLLPNNIRFYYRKGDTEVLLQELNPQIRHLKFESNLLRNNTEEPTVEDAEVHSYSLALPYVNFIYRFKKGILDNVLVSFCDRPLKHLQEQPLKPFFSNVNTELKVCHGSAFQHHNLVAGDISQQIDYCMDVYWQTLYKDEWSQFFWNYKSWFADKEDARFASLEAWQEASIENPLFVIEDVEWEKYSEENYGSIIVRLFDYDNKDSALQQELFADLTDEFLSEMNTFLLEKFKSFDFTLNEKAIEQIKSKVS